jgi:hypothetical protein
MKIYKILFLLNIPALGFSAAEEDRYYCPILQMATDGESCFDFGYGDKHLKLVKSSGADNCCLLFSIIGDRFDLLKKVLGSEDQARELIAKPEMVPNPLEQPMVFETEDEELAYTLSLSEKKQEEDPEYLKWDESRRHFRGVRAKFFQDIKNKWEETFFTAKGEEVEYGFFVERILKDYGILSLDEISREDRMLPMEFATVFSALYEIPVCVLRMNEHIQDHGDAPILYNPMIRSKSEQDNCIPFDLMPSFDRKRWQEETIYVYRQFAAGHFDKLIPFS